MKALPNMSKWIIYCKNMTFFIKYMNKPHTHTQTNFKAYIYLNKIYLKMFWNRSSWIRNFLNSFGQNLYCPIDWNSYPIDWVSAKIILKCLGQCLNERKWIYILYFLFQHPRHLLLSPSKPVGRRCQSINTLIFTQENFLFCVTL